MNEEWGPASVHYGDWRGTAAMDSPDEWNELEEFARVDAGEWVIVGIELYGGKEAELHNFDFEAQAWAAALAIRRDELERLGGADAISAGQRLEVTRFRFRESDAYGVMQAMKRWSVRVARPWAGDADLRIVDEVT